MIEKMGQSSSHRELKKQRTRRSIEQAALRLFEERGFDGTTIDDIAAAAEIAPRTFFHYFPSKEDVALADYATRLEQIVAALKASPDDQAPWRALRGAFLAVGADYETEREHLVRRFRIIQATPSVAARNLQLQTTWEEAIAEVLADWLGRDDPGDVRPRLIAGAALAAMRASLRRWLTNDGRSRLPDHIAHCFDVLGAGLRQVARPE
ncbi:MAG: TetR family transcriptional regulator [Acidimicrobiia bacterium]